MSYTYQLRKSRAPYHGDIAEETTDARRAAEWQAGHVCAVAPDGKDYVTRPCYSKVDGHLALVIVDDDGNDIETIDPWSDQ